jgi:hypothetical protein
MANRLYSFEGARIIFKNFRGEERQFNNKGDRNFVLVVPENRVAELEDEGFKIRTRPPRTEDEDPQYLLPVSVSYKVRAPKVVTIGSKHHTSLTEETVGELDFAEIENLDLTIRPYHWTLSSGRSGTKAYLNSLYATLIEDEFASKYEDFE